MRAHPRATAHCPAGSVIGQNGRAGLSGRARPFALDVCRTEPYFGKGRTPGNTHLPSKYMKITKATTTSAQASNGESSMEFPQSMGMPAPASKVQSINQRVGHVPNEEQ
jgi:hypothetical protein